MMDLAVRRAEDISNALLQGLWHNLEAIAQQWVAQHPIAAWLVTHPLWSLLGLFLLISLLWTLFTLIGQALQQTWIAILRAPLTLMLWLSGYLTRRIQRAIAPRDPVPAPAPPADRVGAILRQLEQLHQEQEALMQELQSLLQLPQGVPQEDRE
jgi:hypothetical protein